MRAGGGYLPDSTLCDCGVVALRLLGRIVQAALVLVVGLGFVLVSVYKVLRYGLDDTAMNRSDEKEIPHE